MLVNHGTDYKTKKLLPFQLDCSKIVSGLRTFIGQYRHTRKREHHSLVYRLLQNRGFVIPISSIPTLRMLSEAAVLVQLRACSVMYMTHGLEGEGLIVF